MTSPGAKILPLSIKALHHVMQHAPAKYLGPLNVAMTLYGIDTGKRVAAFLAQLAVESSELRHTHELWTAKKNFHLAGVDPGKPSSIIHVNSQLTTAVNGGHNG